MPHIQDQNDMFWWHYDQGELQRQEDLTERRTRFTPPPQGDTDDDDGPKQVERPVPF